MPIGVAAVRREGKDLTIVTCGGMVLKADAAAEQLKAKRHRYRDRRFALARALRQGNRFSIPSPRPRALSFSMKDR